MITVDEKKLTDIEPDPSNPRQIFDETKLRELADDIAVRGILQPIVVRPHPTKAGRFMIVFGERRWRAAGLVEMATISAIVREMNDLDVLEAQVAENDKRSDVHPLEEADAYRRLHEDHGRDIDELAALAGKSTAYIYAAMKLCALAGEPRIAFLGGKFDKSRALLIARLPEKQQAEACKAILGPNYHGEPMSHREAQRHLQDHFMLRLASAPFKLADEKLVAKAGPCTTCEKRTGNQRELFDDVINDKRDGGADVCTDSTCYRVKADAHWARVKVEADARGRTVVEGKEAIGAGGHGDKKFLDLDAPASAIGEYNKSYRQVLGKSAEPTAVARTDRGEIRELITRSDLPSLLKEAGVKAKPKDEGETTSSEREREAKELRRLEQLVTVTLREAALAKLDDLEPAVLWRLLARLAVMAARSDAQKETMKLHEVQHEGQYSGGQRAKLIAYADKLPVRAARDFAVELLIAEAGGWRDSNGIDYTDAGMTPEEIAEEKAERRDSMTGTDLAAELLEIDVPAIVAKVKGDIAAEARAKAEKKGSKKEKAEPAAEVAS